MSKIKNVKKYNYFYKITNNLNNHFYYGIHSTNDLEDGYMGSGTRLHYAYKKYGIDNFSKEILKYFETIQKNFYINGMYQSLREEEIKKDFSNYLHDEILQDLLSIKI